MPTLYVVGTPIGNLEDITLRALRVLKEVQLIAAEDTRKAGILLRHYGISAPMTSFFEANERRKVRGILDALAEGDVALISDAGMPGISDPGYPLVRAAIERGYPVVPIPGPSAHTAALVISGLPADQFMFLGFPPRKHPELLGDRDIALCRELTKMYEEIWRGRISDALIWIDENPPRGEFTLVVAGASGDSKRWREARVREALAARMAEGVSRSQAAREVAAESGWRRREIYDLAKN